MLLHLSLLHVIKYFYICMTHIYELALNLHECMQMFTVVRSFSEEKVLKSVSVEQALSHN